MIFHLLVRNDDDGEEVDAGYLRLFNEASAHTQRPEDIQFRHGPAYFVDGVLERTNDHEAAYILITATIKPGRVK